MRHQREELKRPQRFSMKYTKKRELVLFIRAEKRSLKKKNRSLIITNKMKKKTLRKNFTKVNDTRSTSCGIATRQKK